MANPIAKHYARLLSLWPKDPFRPNFPFTRTLERHALPFGFNSSSTSPSSSPSSVITSSSPASSSSKPSSDLSANSIPSPQLEAAQLNALYSLLENRYAKKYPITTAVIEPTSAPDHYTRLIREIEKAPGKGWWTATWERWKNMIRWE